MELDSHMLGGRPALEDVLNARQQCMFIELNFKTTRDGGWGVGIPPITVQPNLGKQNEPYPLG